MKEITLLTSLLQILVLESIIISAAQQLLSHQRYVVAQERTAVFFLLWKETILSVTESQKILGQKGPLQVIWSNLLLKAGSHLQNLIESFGP